MKTVSNDLSTFLAKQLNQRSWSARELARKIGISHTSVSRYLEGSLIPSPRTCRKIAQALDIPDPLEIMRLAGHLPPALPPVAEETEALAILRSLPNGVRAIAMQMLRSLRPGISHIAPNPAVTLAESPPQYTATPMDQEITYLIEKYPDLAPLLDEAQRTLPKHAVEALIHNVLIWEAEKETFMDLHHRLSHFLAS